MTESSFESNYYRIESVTTSRRWRTALAFESNYYRIER